MEMYGTIGGDNMWTYITFPLCIVFRRPMDATAGL